MLYTQQSLNIYTTTQRPSLSFPPSSRLKVVSRRISKSLLAVGDLPLELDVGAVAVGAAKGSPEVGAHVDDSGTSTVSDDGLLGDTVGAGDVDGLAAELVALVGAELVKDSLVNGDQLETAGAGELRGEVGGEPAGAALVEDLVAGGVVGEREDGAGDGHVLVEGRGDVALLVDGRGGGAQGEGRDGDSRSELHFDGLVGW